MEKTSKREETTAEESSSGEIVVVRAEKCAENDDYDEELAAEVDSTSLEDVVVDDDSDSDPKENEEAAQVSEATAHTSLSTSNHSQQPERILEDKPKTLPRRTRSAFSSKGEVFSRSSVERPAKRKTKKMNEFLDQVRRKSNLGHNDSSDDDCSTETEREQKDGKPRVSLAPLHHQRQSPGAAGQNLKLSTEDIEICQRLDDEYERALEEREIGYNARYGSVRQSAFLSVFFTMAYLFLGTAFFMRQTAWTVADSLLFSIYTITTVGYGERELPTTPGFQAYTIFYILVGIAALTIMVAQVYQCIALEASRAQHSRDKTEMAQRGLDILTESQQGTSTRGVVHGDASADEIIAYHHENMPGIIDHAFRSYDRAKHFFRYNEFGRGISVLFPFAGLILIGAVVVGPIEGWTFLEAVYFSVVSLTTVGFGDYRPTNLASIWFCIFWLPFSVGFMSMFLGNVAAFYIRLSDRNIRRIERQMRRRLQRAKDKAELERAEVLQRAYRGQEVEIEAAAATINDGQTPPEKEMDPHTIPRNHAQSLARRMNQNNNHGFDALPTNDGNDPDMEGGSDTNSLFGSSNADSGHLRRKRIIENSTLSTDSPQRPDGQTMKSMRDIVRAVRRNLETSQEESGDTAVIRSGPDVHFMSMRSTQTITRHSMLRRVQTRKPSFALRVLVQERFAEIIATDIAGFQSSIEIKENTLSVTIDSLKEMADKWLIPRRARKAFRAVAFEGMYFVGEHGLITRGADALYDLSPFEFHGLFSPLVAAMGDADTMEGWLASTDILADVDLRRDGSRPGLSFVSDEGRQRLTKGQQERLTKASHRTLNEVPSTKLPRISPGNAFHSGD